MHVCQTFAHHSHLYGAVYGILPLAFAQQVHALHSQVVVLLGMQVVLTRSEVLGQQRFLLLKKAVFAVEFGAGGEQVLLYLQPVFFHRYLGVAQHVLLLGELRFGIENLLPQVGVVEREDYVACIYHGALLDGLMLHDARLECGHLYHHARLDVAAYAYVIIERPARYIGDDEVAAVGAAGRSTGFAPCQDGARYGNGGNQRDYRDSF